jgi:hypothetical protein
METILREGIDMQSIIHTVQTLTVNRLSSILVSLKAQHILSRLYEESYEREWTKLSQNTGELYPSCLAHINVWTKHYSELSVIHCLNLSGTTSCDVIHFVT